MVIYLQGDGIILLRPAVRVVVERRVQGEGYAAEVLVSEIVWQVLFRPCLPQGVDHLRGDGRPMDVVHFHNFHVDQVRGLEEEDTVKLFVVKKGLFIVRPKDWLV